jgi:tRNA pseudouridine55 synthase
VNLGSGKRSLTIEGRRSPTMHGWLVIDKPGGMTSRDVVNVAQKWFPRGTKLGHTGTLDPLATGVLVLCVGAATRLADIVQGMGKTYRSRFRFGATSDTDDADGVVVEQPTSIQPTETAVRAALANFVGEIAQVPPAYSALKVAGKRSHDLARRGLVAPLAARPVRVYSIGLLGYDWPFADVEVECGKGTYIRSIARDLGAELGVGGLVQDLRRTRVGPFTAEEGVGLDAGAEVARRALVPLARAVTSLPRVTLDPDAARRFCHGQAVESATSSRPADNSTAVFGPNEDLLGLAVPTHEGRLRATMVLPR